MTIGFVLTCLLGMRFSGTRVFDATKFARVHFEWPVDRDATLVIFVDFWEPTYYGHGCQGGQRMDIAKL